MSHKKHIITICIILLIVTTLGVFWYTQKNTNKFVRMETQEEAQEEKEKTNNEIVYNNDEKIDTSDWQTYRNEEYGFEMRYPHTLKINTHNITFPSIGDDVKQIAVIFNENQHVKRKNYNQYYWVSVVKKDAKRKRQEFIANLEKDAMQDGGTSMYIESGGHTNAKGITYMRLQYCPNIHSVSCEVRVSEYFIDIPHSQYDVHIRTNAWYFSLEKELILKKIVDSFTAL